MAHHMTEVWAALVRVSSMGTRQAGADNVHTDRDQVSDVEQVAARFGNVEVVWMPPELNVSGGWPIARRPSLLAAVEGVERGEYDAVAVAYLSRLGRSLREQLSVWDRVEAAGGRIILAREDIDTSTRAGRTHRNLLLAIDEDERDGHAERFAQLKEWAVESGIWRPRVIPRGYIKDPGTRRLIPGPDRGDVEWAFAQKAAGVALVEIAERLGMTPSGIRYMLRNRVYLGEVHDGKHSNRTAHEPLVTLEVFEAAQSWTPRPARGRFDGPALLAGLLRCEGCGHVMSRSSAKVVVYTCHGGSDRWKCPAPAAVTAALVDGFVEPIILTELAKLQAQASIGRGAEEIKGRLGQAEAELGSYLDAVTTLNVDPHAIRQGAETRQQTIDEIRSELRAAIGGVSALPPEIDVAAWWAGADAHARNRLLRALLEVVVVRRSGGRGSRTALADRVRVLRRGAAVDLPKRGGEVAYGVVGMPFPDVDDPDVLGPLGAEDGL